MHVKGRGADGCKSERNEIKRERESGMKEVEREES